VRVLADGYTGTMTDANRFYNLSHAICYSYWTDKIVTITSDGRFAREENDYIRFDSVSNLNRFGLVQPISSKFSAEE